ncbi:MAG: GNAT family N-acetyltransferase [Sphingomonas sp.]|nr:GNAT family N-acetyltransferase [Sphingomonas sp.]
MSALVVRRAKADDMAAIHRLLLAFGHHWNHPEWVSATPAALAEAMLVADPKGFGHVAEADGTVVGVALWYLAFNFWMAKPVLYLEDLYVDEAARSLGAGEALLRALATEAVERDCAWMEWIVADDNIAGKRFYARHGGSHQSEYEIWRMYDDELRAFAGER